MKKLALSLLLFVPMLALAAPTGVADTGIRYNNIGIQYMNVEFDDFDVDADGFGISGSYLINEHVFLLGEMSMLESDRFSVSDGFNTYSGTIEQDQFAIGLGARTAIAHNADLVGGAGLVRAEMESTGDFGGLDESDTGFILQAGLRVMTTSILELAATVSYIDIFDDSDTGISVSGALFLSDRAAATAGLTTNDDATGFSIGLRYSY